MKKFELWLDESGDFRDGESNRNKKRFKVPSLVGGILVADNSFPMSAIGSIIPEDYYHSVETTDQLDRFRMIEETLFQNAGNQADSRLIVFSNSGFSTIIDNNITYLNVITEGIIRLIKTLKANYGEVFINVLIANRVDTTTGRDPIDSVVGIDEYDKRLMEKLAVESLVNDIGTNEWAVTRESARLDKRLMLADIVCNTFYTRKGVYKFSSEDREYIERLYNDESRTWEFRTVESLVEKRFSSLLMEGKIGEAVASLCQLSDSFVLERWFSVLRNNIETNGLQDARMQYKFIEAYIDYSINHVRAFDVCENLLSNILEYYMPILKDFEPKSGERISDWLSLDIYFYMLTIYTHMGNISAAEDMIAKCEAEIGKLPYSLKTLDYRIKYEVRKITQLINSFDYENALERVDTLIGKCRDIKEMLGLIQEDQASDSVIHYDELAKALGTRVQIKGFMLRDDPDLYQSAVDDSEEAIREFTDERDKARQYSYRTSIQTAYGNYDDALRFLRRSIGLPDDASMKKTWEIAQRNDFSISAYITLMSECAGKTELSEEMEKEVSTSGYMKRLEERTTAFHPLELIFWKFATYYSKNGNTKPALKWYSKASEICFAEPYLTMNMIGLAVDLEAYSVLLCNGDRSEAQKQKKKLQKNWKRTREIDTCGAMQRVFGDVDFASEDHRYYYDLSRKVTY